MQALLHIDLFSAACNDSVYYTHSVLFISIYVNRYFFLNQSVSFRRFEERMWFLSPKSIVSLWSKLQEGGGVSFKIPWHHSKTLSAVLVFTGLHTQTLAREIYFSSRFIRKQDNQTMQEYRQHRRSVYTWTFIDGLGRESGYCSADSTKQCLR